MMGIAPPAFALRLVGIDRDQPCSKPANAGIAPLTINGWPHVIITWSGPAYDALPVKPADAIRSTDGTWCALRSA